MNSAAALPATPPNISGARLPATYEAAQKAIAACERIDECKTWSDKAAALASYARQAKDDSLRVMAVRIQARAERRCGELLKQIPRADGSTRYGQEGALPPMTRTQAASDAGLSEHQRKNALRMANVPRDEFEAAVESDAPPTVTTLAARGTVSRAPTQNPKALGISPADPAQVAEATAVLRRFAAFCGIYEPRSIACAPSADADMLRGYVSTIDRWLDRFVTNLPAEDAA